MKLSFEYLVLALFVVVQENCWEFVVYVVVVVSLETSGKGWGQEEGEGKWVVSRLDAMVEFGKFELLKIGVFIVDEDLVVVLPVVLVELNLLISHDSQV